jgi:hypothetical protein
MRRSEDNVMDPEMLASLDAIDATLAGEPVDPRFADVAELALLLTADRPAPDREFAGGLDERMAGRFGGGAAGAGAGAAGGRARGRARSWLLSPQFGLAGAGLAAVIVAVVAIGQSGGGNAPAGTGAAGRALSSASRGAAAIAPQAAVGASSAPGASASGGKYSGNFFNGGGGTANSTASAAATATAKSAAPAAGAVLHSEAVPIPSPPIALPPAPVSGAAQTGTVQPLQNGRKIVQSASLQLGAKPTRIDTVAQEVFNTVGSVGGIVDSSNVTATGGLDGYAHFALRVPSSALGETMARLSRLPYASVLSRTDNTQDVNQQYVSLANQIADAQAHRAALLKQLEGATTTAQIDSLKAQIKGVENTIAALDKQQAGLNRQINYSRIDLTIQASTAGVVPPGPKPFGIGKAAHDAGRVLTVGAGVALIVLAALVPLALLVLLGWWIAATLRRRRREQALDAA